DLFQDFLPAHPLLSIALAVAGKHRGEVPGQCETARPRKLEHRSGPTWHLSRPSMASVAVGNPGHRHDCNFHYTYWLPIIMPFPGPNGRSTKYHTPNRIAHAIQNGITNGIKRAMSVPIPARGS